MSYGLKGKQLIALLKVRIFYFWLHGPVLYGSDLTVHERMATRSWSGSLDLVPKAVVGTVEKYLRKRNWHKASHYF